MKAFITAFLLLLAFSSIASAQAPAKSQQLEVQGLAISPFLIESEIEPGQSSAHEITLYNTTDKPIPITVSINDFVPYGRLGQPRFLESNEQADPRYSLSSWITITKQPELTIPPQQTTTIAFTITPPDGSEPGSHYGGLLFSWRTEPTDATVSVQQKVGTIVVAKLGKAKQEGKIESLTYTKASRDINFTLDFRNSGNVHLKPKGEIYVHNIFGQQVGDIYVNPDANIVLPETIRTFETVWNNVHQYGYFNATAVLYYGSPKIEVRQKLSFWILPPPKTLVFLGLGTFALLSLLIFGIKRYNRWLRRKYGV